MHLSRKSVVMLTDSPEVTVLNTITAFHNIPQLICQFRDDTAGCCTSKYDDIALLNMSPIPFEKLEPRQLSQCFA